MAILDPKIKKGPINQSYNHSKTPMKQTPKQKNLLSASKSVDSDSSLHSSGSKYNTRTQKAANYPRPTVRSRCKNAAYDSNKCRKTKT